LQIISTIKGIKEFVRKLYAQSPEIKTVLVPTMGFLHEGHLSLIDIARQNGDFIIVSIFVNPLQFNNAQDLEHYPRNMEKDIEMLKSKGVDLLFSPDEKEVYPDEKPSIVMDYPELTNKLCGKFRPLHFSGVMTIVHNLFQWIKPQIAVFGLKDYQQYLIIKTMVKDLAFDITIMGGIAVREKSGIVLSSRNSRLSEKGKNDALVISRSLFKVENEWKKGNRSFDTLQSILERELSGINIEYCGLYNSQTLKPASLNDTKILVAVAGYVEEIRLIDNILLDEPGFL